MKACIVLVLFWCTSVVLLHAQDTRASITNLDSLAALAHKNADFNQAIDHAREWVKLANANYGKEDTMYTKGLMALGRYLQQVGKYDTAKTLYFEALERNESILPAKHALILSNKQLIGGVFYRTGPVETTEQYLKEVRDLTFDIYGVESVQGVSACHNLGLFYGDIGRMEEAEALAMQALNLGIKLHGDELHPALEASYISVARLYKSKGEFEKSVALYKKAKFIVEKKWGKMHSHYGRIMNNMGQVYRQMRDYATAEKLYKEGLSIRKATLGPHHYRVATVHGNLAGLYYLMKRYDDAVLNAKEAVRINTIALGQKHPRVSSTSMSLARALLALKKREEAKDAVYNGLDANCFVAKIDAETSLDKIATEYAFQSPNLTIYLLNTLSIIYYQEYKETEDVAVLKQCFDVRTAISTYLKRTQAEMTSTKDKLSLLSNTARMAQQSANIAYMLYEKNNDVQYLEAIFSISEDNKSAVLASALQSEQALALGAVPDSLVEQEHAMNASLSSIHMALADAQNKKDSVALAEARKALILAKIQKDSLREVLEKNYPKYNQLKYAIAGTDLTALREGLLDDQTALLEYFIQDTLVYVLLIKNDGIHCHRASFEKGELAEQIKEYRKSLSNYNFILKQKEKANSLYKQMGHYFYKKLFLPVEDKLEEIENLIIIPDGELGHIPFETLLLTEEAQTKETDWKALDYFINRFNVSYSYSAALLLESSKTEGRINNGQVTAYAASYTGVSLSSMTSRAPEIQEMRSNLIALDAVEREVRTLEELFGVGAFFYGNEANEAQFKSTAGDYAIIHLAMHGLLDSKEPMASSLAFTEDGVELEDNFLAAYEIANLQLNSDLVVLSACETGYGKFQQGEGVMSLARAFMYAGVPSLTVSLWQVNDNSTAIIMKSFYKNLIMGMPKDQALAEAKMEYIRVAKGVVAHPAFWSPFIQLGNRDAIEIKKQSYWWWITIGGVLTLLLLIWAGQKWRKRP